MSIRWRHLRSAILYSSHPNATSNADIVIKGTSRIFLLYAFKNFTIISYKEVPYIRNVKNLHPICLVYVLQPM